MDLEGLHYHCQNCTEWFTEKTIPHSELVEVKKTGLGKKGKRIKEIYTCECGGEILDAHETNTVTPYQELQLEMLQDQVNVFEEQIELLNQRMSNIDGKMR